MRNLTQWSSDDRYEWLSAYIDDELVPHDRQQVEQWLATDPDYQTCYRRLMQMQRGFQGLRDQELANLAPLPIQQILEASPPVTTDWRSTPQNLQEFWHKRSLLAITSLSGLGLAVVWAVGLRSPWVDPVAQIQSTPEASVASVPSPLITPSQAAQLDLSSTQGTPQTSPQVATRLVSTEEARNTSQGESGLNFALDQPLLAFPADN